MGFIEINWLSIIPQHNSLEVDALANIVSLIQLPEQEYT